MFVVEATASITTVLFVRKASVDSKLYHQYIRLDKYNLVETNNQAICVNVSIKSYLWEC